MLGSIAPGSHFGIDSIISCVGRLMNSKLGSALATVIMRSGPWYGFRGMKNGMRNLLEHQYNMPDDGSAAIEERVDCIDPGARVDMPERRYVLSGLGDFYWEMLKSLYRLGSRSRG